MKIAIAILMLAGALYLFKQLLLTFDEAKQAETTSEQIRPTQSAPSASTTMPGMPVSLETSLATAQQQGASGLANFLNQYRHAIRDPRLAAIELDYAVLLSLKNPAEASRIFHSVKQRTLPSSPNFERVKSLEKTFR